MHLRTSSALVATTLMAALAIGCDSPTAPTAAPAAAPSTTLQPTGRSQSLADLFAPSSGVTIGGVLFSDVEAMGGWTERFDIYTTDQSTWLTAPKLFLPTSTAAMSMISPPNTPTANSLANWAVVKQTRDRANWYTMEPMTAWHDGMTCAAPPATHTVSTYDDAPFLCRNHMMTATNSSGYGVTYLTPNRLVDFSGTNAVVRFDMATLRSSDRDWIDLWITPYESNLVVPLEDSLPDAQGYPFQGLHIRMSSDKAHSRFEASLIFFGRALRIPPATTTDYETAFANFTPGAGEPAHTGLPSATRRDTFELRMSGGRLKFGMPRYNLWWLDIPAVGLGFTSSGLGVVQLGHHSFAPATGGGTPDTWHWDNIGMAPAVPFSIINADRRYVDQSTLAPAVLKRAAPSGSKLRFAGYGDNFEVRFDGGRWQTAYSQVQELNVDGRFHSYWTPVPTGTTRIEFRADNDPVDKKSKTDIWMARDITVWSLNP